MGRRRCRRAWRVACPRLSHRLALCQVDRAGGMRASPEVIARWAVGWGEAGRVGSPCSVEGFAWSGAGAGDRRGVPAGRVGGGVALDLPTVVAPGRRPPWRGPPEVLRAGAQSRWPAGVSLVSEVTRPSMAVGRLAATGPTGPGLWGRQGPGDARHRDGVRCLRAGPGRGDAPGAPPPGREVYAVLRRAWVAAREESINWFWIRLMRLVIAAEFSPGGGGEPVGPGPAGSAPAVRTRA
jgi:hypothetical protein